MTGKNDACPGRGICVLVPFVFPTPFPAPADRFARIIDGLCGAVAARAHKNALARPLLVLLYYRLRRMVVRLASLAGRVRSGTLPAPARRRAASSRPRTAPPAPRLPRGFVWVPRLVPEANGYASQLQHLLADPAMVALLAAAPQAGRILRPLCRMLGIRPPPGLLGSSPAPASPRPGATAPSPPPPRRPPPPAPADVPSPALRICGPPRSPRPA